MTEQDPPDQPGIPPGPPPAQPNPYGAAPAWVPPPGQGPGPAPRSERWKIWLGIGLSVPALLATGFLTGASGFLDNSGVLSLIVGIAGLLAPIVLLFFGATRKVGLGLLIGYAVIVILLGGACIALLAAYN